MDVGSSMRTPDAHSLSSAHELHVMAVPKTAAKKSRNETHERVLGYAVQVVGALQAGSKGLKLIGRSQQSVNPS